MPGESKAAARNPLRDPRDRRLPLTVKEQGRLVADQGDAGHRDQGQEGDSQQTPDQAAAVGHPALPPVRA